MQNKIREAVVPPFYILLTILCYTMCRFERHCFKASFNDSVPATREFGTTEATWYHTFQKMQQRKYNFLPEKVNHAEKFCKVIRG